MLARATLHGRRACAGKPPAVRKAPFFSLQAAKIHFPGRLIWNSGGQGRVIQILAIPTMCVHTCEHVATCVSTTHMHIVPEDFLELDLRPTKFCRGLLCPSG